MGTRYFALILGIIYTLVGLLGFIPGLLTIPVAGNPPVTFNVLYGSLFGLFPVNILHTLIHLVIGIWGIIAYRTFESARAFSLFVGVAFGLLFLMGLIPGLETVFGLLPLQGGDIWLHLITSVAGLYFGLAAPRGARVY